MLNNFKKILVLAPHTDDGELGAGGSISKLKELGAHITYVAFSIAEESVPEGLPKDTLKQEVGAASKILDIDRLVVHNYKVRKFNYVRQEILEDLIKLRNENDYDLVFTPSLNDIHQDHSVIAIESIRAFKRTTILGYELIWNNLKFESNCFVNLEKKHVELKCKALNEYKSQAGRDYISEDFIYALAKTRGVQVGYKYAENFEVIRWVIS